MLLLNRTWTDAGLADLMVQARRMQGEAIGRLCQQRVSAIGSLVAICIEAVKRAGAHRAPFARMRD